ncbi:uncharacterized protein LOC112554981 isoform X2 [Pomacea canaliculata]|uniref:uncharacterized protein LOC112554981 isoform X2 n=1 Tax=Pomacea canaliculata TaxID=400727 RepID=UPI000D7313B9|nr:uncharacterized protein LOC112554981 isoform X2 [Pomacea canaliculata]
MGGNTSSNASSTQRGAMGGNASRSRVELVQAGVKDGHVVQLKRCSTPFPRGSHGIWTGRIYQIVEADEVLYASREVPPELIPQLGSGNISFSGVYATITFNRNDGNLSDHFLGYP